MTVYPPDSRQSYLSSITYFAEARRLIQPLLSAGILYSCYIVVLLAAFTTRLPVPLQPVVTAARADGLAAICVSALLIAATGLVTCAGLVWARRRTIRTMASAAREPHGRVSGLRRRLLCWPAPRRGLASWIAGGPQALAIALLAGGALAAIWWFWPHHSGVAPTLDAQSRFALAGVIAVLVFPLLICERYFGATSPEWLPEASNLRALLLVPVAFLMAQCGLEIAAGLGVGWTVWISTALSLALAAIAMELAARTLSIWFLPPADAVDARAAIGSVLAKLLQPRTVSPVALAQAITEQFGIDFSRSWALAYMRRALPPVLLLILVFCWFLTGVTRIALNERGSYERFGTPTTIFGPGLHLALPWPFGVVQHVEYGVVHTVSISFGQQDTKAAPKDTSTAEGPPPDSANRLWDDTPGTDVSYIIASNSFGRQSFETISVDLRVMFRVGLDDASARQALYRIADPDAMVRTLSGQLLAHFFAAQTLPGVLGENREEIANQLQTQLQAALDHLRSGIQIVAVVVSAVRPPSGAAEAYRSVQAADIAATTLIATEKGRAETTGSVARRDAREMNDKALATATENVGMAQVALTNQTADEQAYRLAGKPFLLERYLSDLKTAIAKSSLEIIDHRLTGSSTPAIDLRPQAAPGSPPNDVDDGDRTP